MEAQMHIHGNQMILNAVNPYSAAAEKAAATQRAAHMRRMRRKRAAEAAGVSGSGATFAPGGWMHSESHSAETAGLDGVVYLPSAAGADLDFA
jgi:hypothetical protein